MAGEELPNSIQAFSTLGQYLEADGCLRATEDMGSPSGKLVDSKHGYGCDG